jgi:hypothetical protein
MINYYTSRGLSEIFHIKLARWKRWSREFLPPDPLGGLQSGYARQYTVDDAFIVYIGGHLVNNLQFSIPDTRKILKDMKGWLKENGFLGYADQKASSSYLNKDLSTEQFIVILRNKNDGKPVCCVRDIMIRSSPDGNDAGMWEECYRVSWIPPDPDPETIQPAVSAKVIFITKILAEFARHLEIDPGFFPALSRTAQGDLGV